MKVVILCGGKGLRIRDLSEDMPKPMIPIGGYPIVHHIMSAYSYYGFNEFVLCLGYMGWKFKEYFLNYRYRVADFTIDLNDSQAVNFTGKGKMPQWKVTLVETGPEVMTGCRIKRIQQYVGNDTFMLTYGDGISDINIKDLLSFHKSHKKFVTVTSVRPVSRFGKLIIKDNVVTDFQEKPQTDEGLINGGFFVCGPEVFDYVNDNESCSWEAKPLQQIAREGQLMTYIHKGFWMPMDTTREYLLLNQLWKDGEAPWKC